MCKSHCTSCGCVASKISWGLVLIGAINWGLVGAFDFDLVMTIFGSVAWLTDLIYILVGISGLMLLAGGCKCKKCKACMSGGTKEKKEGCCGGGNC